MLPFLLFQRQQRLNGGARPQETGLSLATGIRTLAIPATNGDSAVFDADAGSQTALNNVGSIGNINFMPDVPRSYTLSLIPSPDPDHPITLGPGRLTTLNAILNQSTSYSQNFNLNGTYAITGNVGGDVNFSLQGDSAVFADNAAAATISAAVNTAGHTATFRSIGEGTTTFTGKVTGTGSVVARGPVVLNTPISGGSILSDYHGGTSVSEGATVLAPYGNLSLAGGTIQLCGGTPGSTGTFGNRIVVSGSNNVLELVNGASMLFNTSIADRDEDHPGDLTLKGEGATFFFNYGSTYKGQTRVESRTILLAWSGFLGDQIPSSRGITLSGGTANFQGGTYTKPISLLVDAVHGESNTIVGGTRENPLILSGPLTGVGGLTIGNGTVVLSSVENTYSGGTKINSGATVRTSLANIPVAGGVVLNGGTLAFTDTGTATYSGDMALSDRTTSTISSTEAMTLSGALTGGGGFRVGGGKVTLSGTTNTYSGTTFIPSGTTFALAHTASFPTHGNIHIERGTFDLSGITPANDTVSVGAVSTDTGHGTVKVPIDCEGNSTRISLQTPLNLTGLPFSVEVVGMTPTAGASYVSGAGAPIYVLMQGVTGTTTAVKLNLSGALSSTAYVGQLSVSDGNLLFTLLGRAPSASSPAEVVSGQTSAQVSTHFAISNITSSIMSAVRTETSTGSMGAGGGASSGGSGGGYGDDSLSFSFSRNPFQSPSMNAVESFNMTDGGMSREVKENRQRFKSLRLADTTFWAQPFGSLVRQNTMYGNLGLTAKTAGIVFGGDHNLTSELSVGGGIGYAYTDLRFDADGGKSRIKEKFVTLFGTWFRDSYHLDVSLVGGLQKYKGYRGITGTLLRANNQHDGYQLTPSLGGGYSFPVGDSKAEIFAAFNYAFSHQGKYQERGAGTADLSVKGTDASMLRSEGGAKISQVYACEDGRLRIGAKISLVNKMPMQKGNIVTANAGTFETTVKTQNHIAPGLESGFEWDNGMSAGFSWNGEVGPKYMANEVLMTFKKKLGPVRQKM